MPPALSLLLCASVGLSADDPAVRGRIALLLVDRGVDVFAATGPDAARVERRGAQYVLRWGGVRAAIDASVPSVAELELAQRIALGAGERHDGPSARRVFLEARGDVPLAARARAAEAVLAEGLTLTGQAQRAQRGRCLVATPRGVELRRGEPGRACRPASVADGSSGAPSTAPGANAGKSEEALGAPPANARKSAEASNGRDATAMKSAEASNGRDATAMKSAEASNGRDATAKKSTEASNGRDATAMKSAEASNGRDAIAVKSAEASNGRDATAMKSAAAASGQGATAMKSVEASSGRDAPAMKSAAAASGQGATAMKSATFAPVAPGAATESAPGPDSADSELDSGTPSDSDAAPPTSPKTPALAASPPRANFALDPWAVAAYGGALVRAHGVDPAVGVDVAYQPRWYGVRAAALLVDGGRAPLRVYELLFGVGPSARLVLSRVFTTGAALLLGARMHAYDLDASDRGVRWDFSVDAPLDLTYAGLDPLTVALVVRAGIDSRSRRHVDDDGVLWERGALRFGGGVRVGLSLP